VVSIDGRPSPNYYNDHWVPWSVKSPLLAHLGLFTAAMYQAEMQNIQPGKSAVALYYKVKSIELLQEMLGDNNNATSIEAIAAIIFMMTHEWYWDGHIIVERHKKGLKETIRLRGGLDDLGISGFVKGMVFQYVVSPKKLLNSNFSRSSDYYTACSYDIEITFPHPVSAQPQHPVELSIPFVQAERDFSNCAQELQLSKETAMILDDMRFLLLALLHYAEKSASQQEQMKIGTTAIWIRDRITSLPDGSAVDSPLAADYVYKSCRIALLIYRKAIIERTSLSRICTLQQLDHIWANMWLVKLSRWKRIPGIFLFILLSAVSAAEKAPYGKFMKRMLKGASIFMGIDHFELTDAALMAFVKLQRWLRSGEDGLRAYI
jgi:Fungal specific transcription factor domain